MSFQPRGKSNEDLSRIKESISDFNGLDHDTLEILVDQITIAVQERLLSQGVPLSSALPHNTQAKPTTYNPTSENTPEWKKMLSQGADRIGHTGDTPFQPHILNESGDLASKIDHTLLKPDATKEEILRVCEEARKYHFATVCVNSSNIGVVTEHLKGSSTKPIAVVGFPLGAASSASKSFETREAITAGAQEIDMVINIGALKSRDFSLVYQDICNVVEAAKPFPVKVILETSNLTDEEKVAGCALAKAAKAAFVKTSTGFGSGGATAHDIALMRKVVGPEMGVKASGGIRTFEDASKMIQAGANRIGASASIAIVTKQDSSSKAETLKNKKKPFKSSLY